MEVVENPIRAAGDPQPLEGDGPVEEPTESCLCCCCLAGFIGALVAAFQ